MDDVAEKSIAHTDLLDDPRISPLLFETITRQSWEISTLKNSSVIKYLENMPQKSFELKKQIEHQYPDYPTERTEVMLDLIYGFTRLKPNTLEAQRIYDDYEKEVSARIQHNLVHQIYCASQPGADERYVRAIWNITHNISRLAEKMEQVKVSNFSKLWCGVKNELAIIRALKSAHYRVFLPDYAQDVIEDKDDEVLQLDIRNGIDMIVVSPDGRYIFLVDAKGKAGVDGVIFKDYQGVNISSQTHPCVKETIRQARVLTDSEKITRGIFKTKIIIPPSPKTIMGYGSHDIRSFQEELGEIGSLHDFFKSDIISQLRALPTKNDLPFTDLR
ncbi:MAG: hypothetical protein Q8Q24_00165 [bacterium]|nr:hypothetical protein [bacterium]